MPEQKLDKPGNHGPRQTGDPESPTNDIPEKALRRGDLERLTDAELDAKWRNRKGIVPGQTTTPGVQRSTKIADILRQEFPAK